MPDRIELTLAPPLDAGDLFIVSDSRGIVVFAHADGGAQTARRGDEIAQSLQAKGFSTLLFDLLSREEAAIPGMLEDVPLLTDRLLQAIDALPPSLRGEPLGLLGYAAGAAAALHAAARRPQSIAALVLRSARVDLAESVLQRVQSPTLLLVGAADPQGIRAHRHAIAQLGGDKRMDLVPRASRLFLEAGTLTSAAQSAGEWFDTHLGARADG